MTIIDHVQFAFVPQIKIYGLDVDALYCIKSNSRGKYIIMLLAGADKPHPLKMIGDGICPNAAAENIEPVIEFHLFL